MNQGQIFSSSEGDAWFKRNLPHKSNSQLLSQFEDVRFICQAMLPFKDDIQKVLEIGCSNGIKLETICHHLGATGDGVDPSPLAIEVGTSRIKEVDIKLKVGNGDALPYAQASFDLVYFGFCLYLFDREKLIQSFAEADRVLKQGGFMVITDFDPGIRYKRPYSHVEGVYAYKQDYSAFFTQSGLYYLAEKHSFSHHQLHFDIASDERVTTAILYKEHNPYPAPV